MRILNRLGLLAVVAGLATAGQAATAQAAALDFTPGSVTGQSASNVAGAHADFSTGFEIKTDGNGDPASTAKDITTDLPRGLVGDPTATGKCTAARVIDPYTDPCPVTAAVGEATVNLNFGPGSGNSGPTTTLIYSVPPSPGSPAAFEFFAFLVPVRLDVSVEPSGNYSIRASIKNISEGYPLISTDVTLWGVPADHQGPGPFADTFTGASYGAPLPGAERRPFMTNPAVCDGQELKTVYNAVPWDSNDTAAPATTALSPALTGCGTQPFAPTIDVQPASKTAGAPSGYQVDLNVPQNDDPDGQATPPLKDATVTLPAGTAISPPAADGLDSCTDDQLGLGSKDLEQCPGASKIGTISVETPLLEDPLQGSLYVGKQLSSDPESGDMYRIFLTAYGDGVRLKLRGSVKADSKTGQLTASFLDNPQLPFSKLTLNFKAGDRAIMANPPTCGTYETKTSLSSWGGQQVSPSSTFVIDQGCPTGQFAPGFTAGTTNPFAGSFSPFTMTATRSDADQDLSSLKLDLPSGLLGALGSVPLCGEAQAAAGTCDPSSRIGSTTVSVGTGGAPFSLPGTVSLGGPYKGAPFSLSVAVPAKAGPFDLGLVVVRAALHVDANNARASAVTDPFPTIVGGVPIRLRMVNVALDRPGFIFNATSCKPMQIASTLTSVSGAAATPAVPYQAQGCDKVKLNPQLALQFTGPTSELAPKGSKRGHPGVKASMSWPFGDSGLKQVKVDLPLAVALDADNAQGLCKPAEAAARACPDSSIIGQATAKTQALHEPLTGPIYFVEGTRITASGKTASTLPKLWLKLSGEGVPLDLWADSDVDPKTQQLTTTFVNIPDAPISGFEMEIKSGKGGVLAATQNVCAAKKTSVVNYTGQNGGTLTRNVAFTTPTCGVQIASAKLSGSKLAVRVGGIGAGRVTVSGKGLGKVNRTIKASAAATIKAPLTKATRSALNKGKSVKLALAVQFAPAKGKTVTVKQTVTLKGKKKAAKK